VLRLRLFKYISAGLIVALFAVGAITRPSLVAKTTPTYDFIRDVEPILFEHCYECHGDGLSKGEVALDEFESDEAMIADVAFWEGIYHNIESQLMPPNDEPQPTDQQRDTMKTWIEEVVFKLDPKNPDPGRITVRRLNREEYRNSIRDLVGDVKVDPAADLPPDDTGYGFDTIGDVLSMSPSLLEKYVIAADRVLSEAIRTEDPGPEHRVHIPKDTFRGVKHAPDGTGRMSSNGTVGTKFGLIQDGKYKLRLLIGADHAGDEKPKVEVKFNGLGTHVFEIDATRDKPKYYERTIDKVEKGDRWLEMSFTNDFYDPKNKDPRRRDRNVSIHKAELIGPLDGPPPPLPETHVRLFAAGGKSGSPREKAARILSDFAHKAWRRPVTKDETERLVQFVDLAMTNGDSYEVGVKLGLQAVLSSPNFLFRGEMPESARTPKGIQLIDEHSLATRLSYFIWSSTPDEELLTLADKGELRDNLDAQVDRMLKDQKAYALTKNFAGQWLELRNLDIVSPSRKSYPAWNSTLARAMREETELFFWEILSQNKSVTQFLDADFTYVNNQLAKHYGIPDVKTSKFERVSLKGDLQQRRGGILTHASILTITSNPTRTSPVNRGNWVLANLLGSPPPPPLEDVPELEETKKKGEDKNMTLRQQLELHRKAPLCASCHKRMDPIGFGLENYDGIGAWRDKESGSPIDASSELYTGESFNGPAELRTLLAENKTDAFVHNLSKMLLTYALGRGVEYYDKPALNEIFEAAEEEDYRFQALIHALVDSVPFQYRRAESS